MGHKDVLLRFISKKIFVSNPTINAFGKMTLFSYSYTMDNNFKKK